MVQPIQTPMLADTRGERKETVQKKLPGFNKLPISTKKKPVKPFDLTCAGETQARIAHTCDFCGGAIVPGEIYYQEGKDRFLGTLHGRKICSDCYQVLGATP